MRHHLDPITALATYDSSQAVLPSRQDLDALDFVVQNDDQRLIEIANRNQISPRSLSKKEISDLLSFLESLTDPSSIDLRKEVPCSPAD
jgi:cytochrome c peroxidase